MALHDSSSSSSIRLKAAASAPHDAVIGVPPVRAMPSISSRQLSMTDPEIHRAVLRSFHLSRRIDRQSSLPVVSATQAGRNTLSVLRGITQAQEPSPSPTAADSEAAAVAAAAATAPAAAAAADDDEDDDESDVLDVLGSTTMSIGSSADSWRQKVYDGHRLTGRLLKLIDSVLTASLRSKLSLQMFRSHMSIRKEQRRQIETNRFIIHPFSDFRTVWSLFMALALVVTVVSLPIEIAFYSTDQMIGSTYATDQEIYYSRVISIATCIVFSIDIIVNFRTGYRLKATDEVVLESIPIVLHYLKTWFIFDFLSTFPFDVIYTSLESDTMTPDQKNSAMRLSKLLRLLAIFRLARLARYMSSLEMVFWLKSKVVEMFNVVATIFIIAHWNGCLQYTFCYIEHFPNFPSESWIHRDGLDSRNVTTARRYTRSLFRALSHMLAVGYGQGPPTTTTETWVVMVSMLTGITLYAMFVAYMARLVATLDYSGHKYDAMVSELKEFMRFHKVPVKLQHRVLDFYEHKYRRKFFDEDKFLKHSIVSPPLRKEIAMHSCRHLVRNVTFFKDASTDFIYQIVSRLEFQVYFPREIIIHAGHMTEGMYFIEHGRVDARLPSGVVLERIPEGGYFGEMSLVFGDKQEANVIATDMCDIYCLPKAGYDEVLEEYPEIRNSIRQLAIVRKQRHMSKAFKVPTAAIEEFFPASDDFRKI